MVGAVIVIVLIVAAAGYYGYVAGLGNTQINTTSAKKTFRIVIFDATVSSDQWGVAIKTGLDQAINKLNNTKGYAIKVTYVWSVDPSDVANQMRTYAGQGYNLIIPNDVTYESATDAVVKDFPNIQFLGGGGFSTNLAPNLGAYAWDPWRGYYEAGVLAGSVTKTNTIGFVTAFSFDQANEAVNAFWLGANLTKPHVKIVYAFSASWTDATKGSSAAASLVAQGADVVAGMGGTMSNGAVAGAAQAGAYAVGYLHDAGSIAPSKVLTSVLWNTTSYFTRAIQLAQAGQLGFVYLNFKIYPNQVVYLAPTTNVPSDKLAQANTILSQITSGKLVEPEITTLPSQGQAA